MGGKREYYKKYYQKNKEKLREYGNAYNKEYYKKNKEKFKAKGKRWHSQKPNYSKEYYQKNKEKLREYGKVWIKKNPNKSKEYAKRWKKNNPEKVKEIGNKGYAKNKRNRIPNTYKISLEEYQGITKKCFLCGFDKYSVDLHHIDLNKKNNCKSNFIGLCPNCHMGIHRGKIKITPEELKEKINIIQYIIDQDSIRILNVYNRTEQSRQHKTAQQTHSPTESHTQNSTRTKPLISCLNLRPL